jgi:hypothetical protein
VRVKKAEQRWRDVEIEKGKCKYVRRRLSQSYFFIYTHLHSGTRLLKL